MSKTCSKCGGKLEAGFATAQGLIGVTDTDGRNPHLVFVVLGNATSSNLIAAFQQGIADEPTNRVYGIQGYRCSDCGALELYANDGFAV